MIRRILNKDFEGQKGLAILHRQQEGVGNLHSISIAASEHVCFPKPGGVVFDDTDKLEVLQSLVQVPLSRFVLTTAGI